MVVFIKLMFWSKIAGLCAINLTVPVPNTFPNMQKRNVTDTQDQLQGSCLVKLVAVNLVTFVKCYRCKV